MLTVIPDELDTLDVLFVSQLREHGLYIQCKDIFLGWIGCDEHLCIVHTVHLFCQNLLIQFHVRSMYFACELTLDGVRVMFSVISEIHTPYTFSILEVHAAIEFVGQAIVQGHTTAQSLHALLFAGDNIDDSSCSFGIVFHGRTGDDFDIVYIGGRNGAQSRHRGRHSIDKGKDILVTTEIDVFISIHAYSRLGTENIQHIARSLCGAFRNIYLGFLGGDLTFSNGSCHYHFIEFDGRDHVKRFTNAKRRTVHLYYPFECLVSYEAGTQEVFSRLHAIERESSLIVGDDTSYHGSIWQSIKHSRCITDRFPIRFVQKLAGNRQAFRSLCKGAYPPKEKGEGGKVFLEVHGNSQIMSFRGALATKNLGYTHEDAHEILRFISFRSE